MSELAALKARIERLEAHQALAELVSNYAGACDDHDMPRLISLFTEDACFDSPSGAMVANGRAAIEALFIDLFKIRGPSFHWTHDAVAKVDPQNPTRATGRVFSHAETTPGAVSSLAAMRLASASNAWKASGVFHSGPPRSRNGTDTRRRAKGDATRYKGRMPCRVPLSQSRATSNHERYPKLRSKTVRQAVE